MSDLDYMDKLLDGVEVEWQTLADVTLPTSNIKWRDVDHTHRYIDLSSVSIETKKIIETSEVDATNAPSRAQKIIQEGDVIFATTRPTQMRYCLIDGIYSGEVASTGYCVLRPQISNILPKWILYCIASKRFKSHVENNESGAAYPAISDTKVKAFEIPIPPLNIQVEIVRILDAFTELTAELTAELVARKQQYSYYRDHLLTFEKDQAEWKILGDVIKLQRGKRLVKSQLEEFGDYAVYQNSMTPLGYYHEGNVKSDTTFIISAGAAGEVGYSNVDFWAADDVYFCLTPSNITNKFLYHFLLTKKNKILAQVRRASIPRLSRTVIEKLEIPIPPLAEQERIVAILDKFDTLTTSLTEGLPREIALRQQQYEYYRELLLSFPKAEVANHD